MNFYVKRPIPVPAISVTKENEEEIINLLNSGTTGWQEIKQNGEIIGFHVHAWEGIEPVYYDITKNADKDHLNGTLVWIIKGIHNECYPCVDDVFQDSYDLYI